MVEFKAAIPGEYSPETGRIEYVRLEMLDITPAELDNLCNVIKKWCKIPDSKDPKELNIAVKSSSSEEYPKEKEEKKDKEKAISKRKAEIERKARVSEEKTESKSLHAQATEGILKYMEDNGGGKKEEIMQAIFPGVTTKDKQYFAFHASFHSLHTRGRIRRSDPNDQDSDWIKGEQYAV